MKNWKEYSGHVYSTTGTRYRTDTTIYTFDIETTSYLILNGEVHQANEYLNFDDKEQNDSIKQSTMYIWMIGINDEVYYGRTWKELHSMIYKINFFVPYRKIFYVHNLSWEFQFLCSEFKFKKVMARKSHKVMSAELMDFPITFKCTYFMSNCSLDKLSEQFNLPIHKKVGELDYSKLRTSLTDLDEQELEYCEFDCLVLYEYIKKELLEYKTLKQIPNTSTGKVRKQLHELVDNDWEYKKEVSRSVNTDGHIYNLLISAFSGGYTHSNWLFTDKIIKNVSSFDFTSSYPYVLTTCKFPMTSFTKCSITNLDDMLPIFAYLIKIKMKNVESNQFNNFLSKNKCDKIKGGRYDNGRIIKAEYLETTITDVDWQYIKKSYSFDYEVEEIYCSIYDYLPKQFIEFILEKYVEKTKLKNVEGQEYAYARAKALFNALYGMTVTNNIKDDVIFDNDTGWAEIPLTNEQIIEKLKKEKKSGFLSFSWGVWCTAYARNNLIQNILELDKFLVYSDTDSLKLREGFDKKVILNYNKSVVKKIKQVCEDLNLDFELFEPEDVNGEKHLLGVFDNDGEYKEFITQGAKKYAYIKNVKKSKVKKGANVVHDYGATCDVLEITVSGVPKEGAKELKCLEDFKDDLEFKFQTTNKNILFYTEQQMEIDITDYQGKTYHVNDKSGCCLVPTTYKLSKALEYCELLDEESSRRAVFNE